MRSRSTLHHSRSLSQRITWAIAASSLALTLALAGCGARAHTGGAQSSQQSQNSSSGVTSSAGSGAATSSTGGSTGASTSGSSASNSAALQQLEGIDNQNQSDAQQLNSAQSSAGVNYTSQQTQTQP